MSARHPVEVPTIGDALQLVLAPILEHQTAARDEVLHRARDDLSLIDEFWNHFAEIDMECELRTEGWAHPGSASDERLRQVLRNYKTWVADVLASASNERT